MDEPKSSRRPWLSHEWNVVIVIALVAAFGLGWLGWQAQIVRYRRAARDQIEASNAHIVSTDTLLGPNFVQFRAADPTTEISTIRRLLGDQSTGKIVFSRPVTTLDLEVAEAFPEAEVFGINESEWTWGSGGNLFTPIAPPIP